MDLLVFKHLSSCCVKRNHRHMREEVGTPLGRCHSSQGGHEVGGGWIRVYVAEMKTVGDSVYILRGAQICMYPCSWLGAHKQKQQS